MRILPQVDILEVFNARTAFGWDNRRAEKLASAHGLVAAVGSDSHTGTGVRPRLCRNGRL